MTRFFLQLTRVGNTPPRSVSIQRPARIAPVFSWIPCSHRPTVWNGAAGIAPCPQSGTSFVGGSFRSEELFKKFIVTSLDAPHRIADALFRDSLLEGTIFRESNKGKILDVADTRNATGLFGLCPPRWYSACGLDRTAWRLGMQVQRTVVSEIVGYDAVAGRKTASRIDPAEIMRNAATLYERKSERTLPPTGP